MAWVPFLLYDGRTLIAARFTIPTATSSGLRALGFTYPHTPSWDRPAQLILGCLLGMLAVTRGRRTAVIVLGTAARILLDPEVYSYYTAGILLGAVAYDLVLRSAVAYDRWAVVLARPEGKARPVTWTAQSAAGGRWRPIAVTRPQRSS